MRALWLHHPGDPAAVARGDEYLWGRDLLVAPVAERGAASRRLCAGFNGFVDFFDLIAPPSLPRAGTWP